MPRITLLLNAAVEACGSGYLQLAGPMRGPASSYWAVYAFTQVSEPSCIALISDPDEGAPKWVSRGEVPGGSYHDTPPQLWAEPAFWLEDRPAVQMMHEFWGRSGFERRALEVFVPSGDRMVRALTPYVLERFSSSVSSRNARACQGDVRFHRLGERVWMEASHCDDGMTSLSWLVLDSGVFVWVPSGPDRPEGALDDVPLLEAQVRSAREACRKQASALERGTCLWALFDRLADETAVLFERSADLPGRHDLSDGLVPGSPIPLGAELRREFAEGVLLELLEESEVSQVPDFAHRAKLLRAQLSLARFDEERVAARLAREVLSSRPSSDVEARAQFVLASALLAELRTSTRDEEVRRESTVEIRKLLEEVAGGESVVTFEQRDSLVHRRPPPSDVRVLAATALAGAYWELGLDDAVVEYFRRWRFLTSHDLVQLLTPLAVRCICQNRGRTAIRIYEDLARLPDVNPEDARWLSEAARDVADRLRRFGEAECRYDF